MSGETTIEIHDTVKTYYLGIPNEPKILHGISLSAYSGEFVSTAGASSSGKSTLTNLTGAPDRSTSGEYLLDGVSIRDVPSNRLSDIRSHKIDFMLQIFNLTPRPTPLGNVELPMLYTGVPHAKRVERSKKLLELVGMSERARHIPDELSDDQKQRVATTHTAANSPSIILADEPVGAFDSPIGHPIIDLFRTLHEKGKKTIVLIIHSQELVEETDRIITIRDGYIISSMDNRGNVHRPEQEAVV